MHQLDIYTVPTAVVAPSVYGPTHRVNEPLAGAVKVIETVVNAVVDNAVKFCFARFVAPFLTCILKLVAEPN